MENILQLQEVATVQDVLLQIKKYYGKLEEEAEKGILKMNILTHIH